MGRRKHAGGASTEVSCLEGGRRELLSPSRGLLFQGRYEMGEVRISRGVLVEGAVGADTVAERDVDVEVDCGSWCFVIG